METALSNHDLNSYEDGKSPENGAKQSDDVSVSVSATDGKEQDSPIKLKTSSNSERPKTENSSHQKSNHSHKDKVSSSHDKHHKHHEGDHKSKENHVSNNSHHKESSSSKHRDEKSKSSSSSHHSSSSKHKSKHSSKEGHSSSSSKDKTKEGHGDSSSKSKDKSHSSSSSSISKSKESGSSKPGDHDKHKDKPKDSHSSSKYNGEKKHSSSSNGEKKSHSSSSSKHSSSEKKSHSSSDKKSHSDKGKDGEKKSHSSSDKGKEGEKKSHSSDKGEKKHSSSEKKEKHKESSSGEKKNHDIPEIKKESDIKKESSPSKHKSSDEKAKSSEKSKHDGHGEKRNDKKEHKHDKDKIKKEPREEKSPEKALNISNDFQQNHSLSTPVKVKKEEDSDSDVPLAARKKVEVSNKVKKEVKREAESDSEDEPLAARANKNKKAKVQPTKKRKYEESDDDSDVPYAKKKKKMQAKQKKPAVKQEAPSPRKKKADEAADVWKWWEEEKYEDGRKWTSLEHKGPVFAPEYEPLPENVRFYYDGKKVKLSEETEELATFYGKMIDHDYTTKESFNKNFFKDWRKVMNHSERELITDIRKCNFKEIDAYFKHKSEERKAMSKEEKKEIKLQNEEMTKEYGFCIIDGHKEKIGNFRIEPPGLFRGRGEHPKMGMLKKRLQPEDIIINCSKGVTVSPPSGHKWKEVRHDNKVTWLASWTENVQGQVKYIMLNASSRLKGEKDWQKYEIARKLKKSVVGIRAQYMEDWKSKEMKSRQRAVALYFIDKLALRAGNEKDEDQADTVGCCSLRVEHIKLYKEKDGKECVVEFDFLGKDSIRYFNSVAVEKRVFKNLQLFMENKKPGDDLFDRLNTSILNQYLNGLMEGLTAKVFRTYNASTTLQDQLDKLTDPDDPITAKILSYNRANRAVAILCNHQRAAPKTFEKSMENLQKKMQDKEDQVYELEREVKKARKEKNRKVVEVREKQLQRAQEQLAKQRMAATDKEENKEIALGTSKLNYLDPRISVAWCKKFDIPIDKIYNRTQRDKFRWAIDMTEEDFVF